MEHRETSASPKARVVTEHLSWYPQVWPFQYLLAEWALHEPSHLGWIPIRSRSNMPPKLDDVLGSHDTLELIATVTPDPAQAFMR